MPGTGRGNLYFSEGYLVRKLSGGAVITIAGNGLPPSYTTDGNALSIPAGSANITVDASGNIYLGEVLEARVTKISPDGTIRLYACAQQPLLTSNASFLADDGDNGPATLAHLSAVNDIALDAAGNLYIAESASIRRVSPGGVITTIATGTQIGRLAVSSSGGVYAFAGNDVNTGIYQAQSGGSMTEVVKLASLTVTAIGIDASSNLYAATTLKSASRWLIRAVDTLAGPLFSCAGVRRERERDVAGSSLRRPVLLRR